MRGGNAACLITGMGNDATSEQIINAAGGFWAQVELFISVMLLPSRLYQVAARVSVPQRADCLDRLQQRG